MTEHEDIDARPLLTRRMAWDMLPHWLSPVVMRRLGLVPPGLDSEAMEHEESHRRTVALLEIEAAVVPLLGIAKQVMCRAMLGETDEDECIFLNEEIIGEIVGATTVGMLSQLLNTEVVQVNDGLRLGGHL